MSQGGVFWENGDIKLEHYSVTSAVKLTVTDLESTSLGGLEKKEYQIWLDYKQIEDLNRILPEFIAKVL